MPRRSRLVVPKIPLHIIQRGNNQYKGVQYKGVRALTLLEASKIKFACLLLSRCTTFTGPPGQIKTWLSHAFLLQTTYETPSSSFAMGNKSALSLINCFKDKDTSYIYEMIWISLVFWNAPLILPYNQIIDAFFETQFLIKVLILQHNKKSRLRCFLLKSHNKI